MIGLLFSGLTSAGSRIGMMAVTLGIWLLSRPGGWAVLVVLILLGLKVLPTDASSALP